MALIGPVLRRRETEHLLESARLIAACPGDTPDRIDEARQLMKRVLLEHSLGNISAQVREAIVRTLAFAIDRDAVAACTYLSPLTHGLEPTERVPVPDSFPDSQS